MSGKTDNREIEIARLKAEIDRLNSIVTGFKKNISKISEIMNTPEFLEKMARGDNDDLWNISGALLRQVMEMGDVIRMYLRYRSDPFDEFCSRYQGIINPDSDVSVEDQIALYFEKCGIRFVDLHLEFFALQEEVCRIARNSILNVSRNGKIEPSFSISDSDLQILKKKLDRYEELRNAVFTVERITPIFRKVKENAGE